MKIARFAVNGQVLQGTFENGRLVALRGDAYDPGDVVWLPPVASFSKMIGLALNYSDHAAELNLQLPPNPILFNKNPNTLIGHRGKVVAPKNVEYMHYENELVVVIGQRCRRVQPEHARDYILGRETVRQKALHLGHAVVIHNDIRTADQEFDLFQNVTLADVQRVARTYFTPESRMLLTVLPASGASGGGR